MDGAGREAASLEDRRKLGLSLLTDNLGLSQDPCPHVSCYQHSPFTLESSSKVTLCSFSLSYMEELRNPSFKFSLCPKEVMLALMWRGNIVSPSRMGMGWEGPAGVEQLRASPHSDRLLCFRMAFWKGWQPRWVMERKLGAEV